MIKRSGFTLSEVLIALALLGVVAMFSVPKLLQIISDQRDQAIAKESIAALSEAFVLYKKDGRLNNATTGADIVGYLNQLTKVPGSTQVDNIQNPPPASNYLTSATIRCDYNSWANCTRLHNGAILLYYDYDLGTLGPLAALPFHIDTDGKASGQPSLILWLSTNGSIKTSENMLPGTYYAYAGNYAVYANPVANTDPPWFHW